MKLFFCIILSVDTSESGFACNHKIYESLQNYSIRLPPFSERALKPLYVEEILASRGSEKKQFKGHFELLLWEL